MSRNGCYKHKPYYAVAAFKAAYSIGAVNSINIGRIAARVVYYVWAWLRMTDEKERGAGAEVDGREIGRASCRERV